MHFNGGDSKGDRSGLPDLKCSPVSYHHYLGYWNIPEMYQKLKYIRTEISSDLFTQAHTYLGLC